jgi:signal transduction histidine kinase
VAAVIAVISIRLRSIQLKSRELERQVREKTQELNQANEQLRQADALKSNFLSLVSHEIKTPLNAILGFAELITGKIEKTILPKVDLREEKTQKAAETIVRDLNILASEGDRLVALVNNLLNISKIEAGKIDWNSRPLSISALVGQSLSITKPMIEKSGLAVQVAIDEDLPEISGDQDMLTQVLINLISNAVKFTREGYLKISARHYEGQILVSLEDTGMGIREDHLSKIFEKFYKAEPSLSANNGTSNVGLGLYISKQIIEQHGGTIWAESQFGKGSTFYFTLPYYSEQSPPS